MNYKEDLHIDENALDIEWLEQPKLMMQYLDYLADAKEEVARLERELTILEAELDRGIRFKPEQFDIPDDAKITESLVKSTMITQERHQDLTEELMEARNEVQTYKGAVEAFQQRKTALEELVTLHGQRYFAGPKVPRNISYEAEQARKKRTSNESINIKRRKK